MIEKQEISLRIEFDTAHRLLDHQGKCRNLHGHRYVLELWMSGELNSQGFIVDFGEVKQTVKTWIDSLIDHGTILSTDERNKPLTTLLTEESNKLLLVPFEPTVENLSVFLIRNLAPMMADGVKLEGLRLWETPNCSCMIREH